MPMIKFNPNPTFSGTVFVPVAGEEPAELPMVFKHMKKEAFSAFVEAGNKAEEEGKDDPVAMVLTVAESWGLEQEFNAENVREFLQNYQMAGRAIMAKYAELLMLGRLGN